MKKTIKKIILSILIGLFLVPTFSATVKADDVSPWYNQGFKEWYLKTYDDSNPTEIFGERYTATQVQWVFYGVISFIMHQVNDPSVYKCLIDKGKSISDCADIIKRAAEKLISLRGNSDKYYAINSFTSRPISFVSYINSIKEKLSLVKEAKAQTSGGFGFGAAETVQKLWQMTRNISYFLLVIVVVVFSFMIMFRVKISPQTVITVQSALPKIVFSLILITFSYAIAGLLIDIMYLVIGMIASLITSNNLSGDSVTELFRALTDQNSIFSLIVTYFFTFSTVSFLSLISGWAILALPAMFILHILVVIVALITLFFMFFKILWLLLKTYTSILLQIIIGPLQILIGTISPNSGGFSKWLKSLAANLAVYPAMGFMFFLSFLFLRGALDNVTLFGIRLDFIPASLFPFKIESGVLGGNSWSPPLTAGEKAVSLLYVFVSFTIITLIPKTADIIKGMIEGKPLAYGTAIGEALFGPFVTAGQVSKTGQEIARGLGLLRGRAEATTPPPKPKIKAPPPGSVNGPIPLTYE